MATGREIVIPNKSNAVSSSFSSNKKLTGIEINHIRDKHNAVDQVLETVRSNQVTLTTTVANNITAIADNNANIDDLDDKIDNHTLDINDLETKTNNITNKGNDFNQANKLLELDSQGLIPDNLLRSRFANYYQDTLSSSGGFVYLGNVITQIPSSNITLSNGKFSMKKGVYKIDISFKFEEFEINQVRLVKNGVATVTKSFLHSTSMIASVNNGDVLRFQFQTPITELKGIHITFTY